MTSPKYKPVRVYENAHAALKALTEHYKFAWGYRNLTMTEYLSKLIIQTAKKANVPFGESQKVEEQAK